MAEETENETDAQPTETPAGGTAEAAATAAADDAAGGAAEDAAEGTGEQRRVKAINEVWIETTAILGTTHIPVSQLLKVGRGAVIELDSGVDDLIQIVANEVLIARGDVVIVDDKIAVQISEMVKRESG